ncbi:MAG TPA: arsenate reductase family protein [Candidatus Didemnitutus sp.]|jgi:arsenate reductase
MPSRPFVLYAYSGCSTCRDATKWLRAHKIDFGEKPIYETPPTVPELRQMMAFENGNLRRLFNTSGMVYRELGLAEKLPKMSEAESLALLAGNGRLVKRPFLLGGSVGLVGFDPAEWGRVLSGAGNVGSDRQ